MKKFLFVLIPLFALVVFSVGCNKPFQMLNEIEDIQTSDQKSGDNEEPQPADENGEEGEPQPADENDECVFCLDLDVENPEKSIPVINKFLSGLTDDLTGVQKIDELEKWLNLQPCVLSAEIQHYSSVKTNPPTGEFHIRFGDGGKYRFYVMDVAWSQPMTVTGFHDIWHNHENTTEPVLIPSNKYLLCENCSWSVEESFPSQLKLVIINNEDELKKYITCIEDGKEFPEIDFTKHTVLFVHGVYPGAQDIDSIFLHRFPNGSYVLDCGFRPNIASVVIYLKDAVIIDKFDERNNIGLKMNALKK